MIAQKEKSSSSRPGLIVAHSDPVYSTMTCRSFRKLGWDVYVAESGTEVRLLARVLRPAVVVLDTRMSEESGWLTCVKLTREHPNLKVILTSLDQESDRDEFANFVGAASLVSQADGVPALVAEVCGSALPAVG